MRTLAASVFSILFVGFAALADEPKPAKPSATDKCPVCGMFVAKYPDFLAQIHFSDGMAVFFDGAKDMFKYYLSLKKYAPSRDPSRVAAVYVTDYYSLLPVDGKSAYYVVGSNVFGPMGKELIPFEKESDANEFLFDHVGKEVLPFKAVTLDVLQKLD